MLASISAGYYRDPAGQQPGWRRLLLRRRRGTLARTVALALGGAEGAVRPEAQGASLGAARSWMLH
jgi:hypothetical protein